MEIQDQLPTIFFEFINRSFLDNTIASYSLAGIVLTIGFIISNFFNGFLLRLMLRIVKINIKESVKLLKASSRVIKICAIYLAIKQLEYPNLPPWLEEMKVAVQVYAGIKTFFYYGYWIFYYKIFIQFFTCSFKLLSIILGIFNSSVFLS